MEKLDPRAQRSRTWMKNALLELLQEKTFEKITITDITERAGLSRPTFYLHYKNKEDIIAEYFYEIFKKAFDKHFYLWKQDSFFEPAVKAFTAIFEVILENQNIFLVVIEINQYSLIYHNIRRYTLEYLKNVEDVYSKSLPEKTFQILASSLAGTSTALIVEWLLEEDRIPPAKMGEILVKMLQPNLNSIYINGLLKGIVD